ncbi:MAG: glycosyltransferase family 9 protein [Planctomycetota bacterium]|nr:glycosyltransferase family 9 protein [Planctomycetota bacterium]
MSLGHTLIVRPGALGDAVLTLPTLHALRLAGAESLTVLGTPASWAFARVAHEALRIRDFAVRDWLGLFAPGLGLGPAAQAALARTDTAIVYLNGDTGGVEQALKAAGVKHVLVGDPPKANEPPTGAEPRHAARRLLDAVATEVDARHIKAALRINAVSSDVFLRLEEGEAVRALGAMGYDAPPAGGFVAVHPGSGGRAKCWPAGRFAEVAGRAAVQGLRPLVFFGPADDAVREEFEAAMPAGLQWESAVSRPLREVLALLSCARCFLGNDSGMTHLAARACPTVALFGPTDPRAWAPLGQRVRVLRAPGGDLTRLRASEVSEALADTSQPTPFTAS